MEHSSTASNSRQSFHGSSGNGSSSRKDSQQSYRHGRPLPQRHEGQRFDHVEYDEHDDYHRRRQSRSKSNRRSNNGSWTSRDSTPSSRDPDGKYEDNIEGCEPSHGNIEVEQYASRARKKASLMTNHDFSNNCKDKSRRRRRRASSIDRERIIQRGHARSQNKKKSQTPSRRSDDDNDDDNCDECHHCENVQNSSTEQVPVDHIPPPTATSMVGQYIPSSSHSAATSVSSMTTKDSYVRQQLFLRDLARYKSALHESGYHFNLGGKGNIEDDLKVNEHVIQEENEDEENSMFRVSKIHQFGETGEGDGLTSLDFDEDDITNNRRSGVRRPTVSTASRTKSSYSTRSGRILKQSSTVGTPVYQIEECCIKHPHVLLQDQTDINVWTCMRYCKDSKTGRWVTVKKVCAQCLGDLVDSYEDSWRHHSHEDNPSHSTEETSSSSSTDEEFGNCNKGATVSVYGDDDQTPLEREAEAQRRRFIRRLAARAYHFPGNTWFEDWLQYTRNTHLVFGIFFHHKLHPVTSKERCIILLGSVAVGLLMSNLIYLWFVEANFGMHDPVVSLGPHSNLQITKLMVTLWTLGSFAHTIFDLFVWHIKACTLCRYGGNVSDRAVKCGRTTGVTIVMLTLAFSTYLVLLRASEDSKKMVEFDNTDTGDDAADSEGFFHSVVLGGGASNFDFLLGYFVEFILAVFVYSPLILTIVFTGILGCDGRIPVLGGRPREVAKEQRYAMKRQRYIMPQTLKLGDKEYEADLWCDQRPATNF